MASWQKFIFGLRAWCGTLVLLAPSTAAGDQPLILPSVDSQTVAFSSCDSSNEGNVRATFSKAWEQVLIRQQIITDLKKVRTELASQRTWWGGDPTSNTTLGVGIALQTLKSKSDLVFDLLAGSASAAGARPAVCGVSVLKRLAEKIVLDDGSIEDIGIDAAQCIKDPSGWYFETMDVLDKIGNAFSYAEDTVEFVQQHGDLRAEVKKQSARLDIQIARYEQSNREAQDKIREMERVLREAIRAHCANPAKLEDLQRVMDQTRAGMAAIRTKHREVMERVDLAREQRTSATTQQMLDRLQQKQQEQLMLLQQRETREQELRRQEMRDDVQPATGGPRFNRTSPPAHQSLPPQGPQFDQCGGSGWCGTRCCVR